MAAERRDAVASRLLALDCPYLQGMEGNVLVRVVLTPGEARSRVLCWLIGRFRGDLKQLNTSTSLDTGSLMNHLANIGVCGKDDICLVEGHTSLQQQLLFIESLLNIVDVSLSEERISQLECSCRFTDTLCSSENLDTSVFPRSLNLLPADISLPGFTTGSRLSRQVSVEQLSREVERLAAVLQSRQAELRSITQQHQYEQINGTTLHGCVKTLAVSVGTLTQLVVNFCQSYVAELQPWVGHRQPPSLGRLGPLCKKTATHWNNVCKILHSLQQVEASLERLCALRGISITPANLYPACQKTQETLQQCIDTVADSSPI